MTSKQTLCEAASGRIPADTVFKNGKIINVITQEIYAADVAVYQGMIVGIGSYHGSSEIDCSGKYLCPGLMDAPSAYRKLHGNPLRNDKICFAGWNHSAYCRSP